MTLSPLAPASLILAIDQGGQSSRVAVYSTGGEQLCCFASACATQIHTLANSAAHSLEPNYFIEQSGEEILSGIRESLQKIQASLGDQVGHICAAGFAGQGSSLLCWDKQTAKALTPVLSWQDIRGEDYLKDFPLSHQQVQSLSGLRISPHYGASKMRWCMDHSPEVAAALSNNRLSIGPIVSYIFCHLLQVDGSRVESRVDPGHAQRTLLWNLTGNCWDSALLDHFHIARAVLPECLYHNSHFGDLTLGDYKIPFSASARDQGASLFARGLPEREACYINIGTGAFIQRVSENLQAPAGLLVSPLWLPKEAAGKKCYAWEATVNGAASALQYLQGETGLAITPDDIKRALALNPVQDCYLRNAIGGLSAPYWRTDLQTGFSENLSPDEKILAWLESVIFQIVVNVQLMSALGAAQKIYISGGLSNADALCQKIADLCHTPVYRSDNSDATLQGIACMAAGIPAHWQASSCDDVFNPQQNIALQSRFNIWHKAMIKWLQ